MAQLVRIAGDVDAGDAAVADVQRRGLQHLSAIDADIARQSVDGDGAQQPGRLRMLARQPREETQHPRHAVDGVVEGEHPAAAVRNQHDVLGEHRLQRADVPIPRGGEEGLGDPVCLGALDRIARPRLAHMTPRPRGELAHRRRLAL
jgi:hypothetical protein